MYKMFKDEEKKSITKTFFYSPAQLILSFKMKCLGTSIQWLEPQTQIDTLSERKALNIYIDAIPP